MNVDVGPNENTVQVSGGVDKEVTNHSVTPGKIAELYHSNWVSAPPGWPLDKPTGFAEGLAQTLAWYRAAGWLPKRAAATTTSPNPTGKT